MRVLVTGSKGQLAGAIVEEFAAAHEVVALDRQGLDVTDDAVVRLTVEPIRPHVVISCTGYNGGDRAEEKAREAMWFNGLALRSLASPCRAGGATLARCRTDFVFDANLDRPLVEDASPNAKSAYAISKLLGEWFAADAP